MCHFSKTHRQVLQGPGLNGTRKRRQVVQAEDEGVGQWGENCQLGSRSVLLNDWIFEKGDLNTNAV